MSILLADSRCEPVRSDTPGASQSQIDEFASQILDWQIVVQQDVRQLKRVFVFENFIQALGFTNRVGEIAEVEDHHPALLTEWGRVTVTWWTHVVEGLHRNDFIMAAKTDRLHSS